ncbi:MAG: PTS glucitol/sorbitol transporter subunit IIB [Intestinibacter sp.]|uniref:PTS glucitol/sorbitol transporter subunit IIB n=1 Tax=Intestinibacter sp. TaxID=1965304 RepID=UPI003F142D49
MSEYKSIVINRGANGWGGPLTIVPTETKNKILVVTGGGFPPLAQHIANMTGCELVDGFKTTIPDEEVILAIVDCGGTARCGVYPKKGIFTVNLTPVGKSGPLAKFITEEIYVSDVKESDVSFCDGTPAPAAEPKAEAEGSSKMTREEYLEKKAEAQEKYGEVAKEGFLTRLGKGVGNVVSTFYQAARDAVQTTLTNILPFMIFVSLIVGIINGTGVGNWLANTISPLASSLPGMLVISLFCALPFISPLIGPGAVIAQIIGVLLGNQIAQGGIQPQYALPALFAIDAQVGGDFVPVGLSLSEAEAETVEIGVPAVLFSRVITGPLAVLIAYAASFGMF